jgi:hypothetical protein
MNKRLLLTMVALLLILLVVVAVTQITAKSGPVTSITATSTEVHKLLGYYSTYQIGTTTCSVFVAPSGDSQYIWENGLGIYNQEIINKISAISFAMFNVDLNDLSGEQQKILLNSSSTDIGYVYLDVKSAGKYRTDNGLGNSCESYVKMVSVMPMVLSQSDATSSGASQVNESEYVGTISSSTDGQNVYTNYKYKFRFEYPQGWFVGDNHLGYGSFQLFNYDASTPEGGKSQGNNKYDKIEVGIGESEYYGTSDIYPEKNRTTEKIQIAGQAATRQLMTLQSGQEILAYAIPIQNLPGRFLTIAIYGDPSNFSVLDHIVSTINWI